MEPHDYRIYYVKNVLRHQYGISVAESQTFLLAKRSSEAMSEEKRLSFAGSVQGRRILCLVPVMGANTVDYDIRCLLNNIHHPLPRFHVTLIGGLAGYYTLPTGDSSASARKGVALLLLLVEDTPTPLPERG